MVTFLVSMVVLCLNTIFINIHFDVLNSNMKLTCRTAQVWQTHRSSYFLYLLTPYLCSYLLQCWRSLFFCLSSPVETSEKDTAQYLRIQKCSHHSPLESLEDSEPPPSPVYYFFSVSCSHSLGFSDSVEEFAAFVHICCKNCFSLDSILCPDYGNH